MGYSKPKPFLFKKKKKKKKKKLVTKWKKRYSTWFDFFVYRHVNIYGLFKAKTISVQEEEEEEEEEETCDEVKIKI